MKRTTRAQWGGQHGHIRRTTRTQWGGLHGNNEEDRADTMRRTEQTQWRGPYRDTMRRTTQTQWGGTRQTQWGGRHGNMRRITWRTMRRTTRTHQEDHTNTWGEPHGHNDTRRHRKSTQILCQPTLFMCRMLHHTFLDLATITKT